MFHELLSRDHETGNPLVADAACGEGLSLRPVGPTPRRAERSERELDGRAPGQPQGVEPEAYLSGTSQGPMPEDARLPARRAYSSERRTVISVVRLRRIGETSRL
jgi:hypothetical protein